MLPRYKTVYQFLWSMIKPYKGYYLVMFMAPILTAFYEFTNQYSLKLIIDAFSVDQVVTLKALISPVILFISAQILLEVVWRISDVAEWRSEPYVRRSILLYTYDYVQHHAYTYFQNTETGKISSKIKGVLDGYDEFWASMHHDFTIKVANSVILILTLAVVNLQICAWIGAWALVFFGVMYRLSRKLDALSYHYAESRHHLFGSISDNITNIFTLFSFSSRKHEYERIKQNLNEAFIPRNLAVYRFGFKLNIIAGFFYLVMLVSLFLYMIHLRQSGTVSNGDLIFVMGTTLKMSNDLWGLISKMQNFMRNLGDFKSAFNILQIPNNTPTVPLKDLKMNEPSIVFDIENFSYQAEDVIFKDLKLSIAAGEKVGIVGSSGAGKSSLIALLLKNFPLEQGKILISDQDIQTLSDDSVRENIAFIPQDILLFHRSILENIRYGHLEASPEEILEAAKSARVHDFIMTLPKQYQTEVGERGVKLSGGQRQRIAIARAFLKKAPILILDEATSSLDAETEQLIQGSLNDFFDNKKMTIIAIAHRLSTLKHMDRIVVMEKGRIIEQGTHEDLIKNNSLYKRLWDLQQI